MNAPQKRGINLQTIVGVLAGVYGVSPIDAMPEALFGPFGYGDDLVVVVLALVLMLAITLADGSQGGAQ